MTLSLEDVPALPADVRLRVLATALDPDAPPAADALVPADTLAAEPVTDDPVPFDGGEPYPDDAAAALPLDVPGVFDDDALE